MMRTLLAFIRSKQGNITIMFGLTLTMIMAAIGGGLDLSVAFQNRQKLAQTALLACQYASRPSIVQTASATYAGTGGGASYVSSVNTYINSTLQKQNFKLTQTAGAPFTYTQGGTADVTLSASVPTNFMSIFRISTIPVTVTVHCYDKPDNIQQTVADGNSTAFAKEGFENSSCSGTCWIAQLANGTAWNGSSMITPTSTFSSTVGYTGVSGATGLQWHIMGYCLEIDTVGLITSTVPEGSHSAELDCENGNGTGGNSSISTLIYFAVGKYQIQYSYISRIAYPSYNSLSPLCASTASSLAGYNSGSTSDSNFTGHTRTNQINVYLDLNSNGSPPTHKTLDNALTLAGSNLIDMCLYATAWTQRTINVTITTSGWYWLSFAADGANDSYGGEIDSVQVCNVNC